MRSVKIIKLIMYIVAILFICAVGVFTSSIQEDHSKWDERLKNCAKVFNITPEEMKKFSFEEMASLYLICEGKRLGQLNEDGTLNNEKILSMKKENASVEKIKAILEKCNSVKVNHNDFREEIKYLECFQKEGISDLVNPIEI